LLIQACAGIGYAHRAGLVHCDVKPLNMLVTPDMRLKVTDFGIARALSTIHPEEQSEIIWGSPQYFSPEQASGAAPSPASDVYSLGVIMYEMLTGSLPFHADTAVELAQLHIEAEPVPIAEMLPDIPPELEQILAKLLSKEPSQRYRTADQLGRLLLNFGNARSAPALSLTPEAVPVPASISATTTVSVPAPGSEIDWVSVGLGLLALVAVLGLVPFWLWVYFVYNPPIR
jgi:serine/threonine-protein kinase